jgi:Sec-independent protein translocase protein TatA
MHAAGQFTAWHWLIVSIVVIMLMSWPRRPGR